MLAEGSAARNPANHHGVAGKGPIRRKAEAGTRIKPSFPLNLIGGRCGLASSELKHRDQSPKALVGSPSRGVSPWHNETCTDRDTSSNEPAKPSAAKPRLEHPIEAGWLLQRRSFMCRNPILVQGSPC